MISSRSYWILAPGALIAGLSYNFWVILVIIGFSVYLLLNESYLLFPWMIIGMYLGSIHPVLPDIIIGTVSLITDNGMHVIDDNNCYWKVQTPEPVSAGNRVAIKIKPARNAVTPRSYVNKNNVILVEYIEILPQSENFRQKIYSRCYRYMDHDAASIASALIVDVSDMSPEIRQNFTNAGLSHLLAISGLHVSIVAGGAWWVARRLLVLLMPSISELLSVLIAVMIGVYYALLAGCGVSILRSILMFLAMIVSWYNGRSGDPIRVCGLVACLLLLISPADWCSPSFVLSFIATATLLTSAPYMVQVTTAPYVLYFFSQLPLEPFISNLFAIPWTTCIVMPILILNILCGCNLYLLMYCLECSIQPLLWLVQSCWSPVLYCGMLSDLSIVVWTLMIFMFFITQQWRWLLMGLVCICGMMYFAEPSGPIAMRYGTTYGVYDNGILWASKPDSSITKQWSAALGNIPIRDFKTNSAEPLFKTRSGTQVWFGRKWSESSNAADMHVWLKNNESEWIWLESRRVWRG